MKPSGDSGLARQRERMVADQVALRGVADERVLAAMRAVPREAFVPAELAELAFEDGPLPIGAGQTISQPYVVGLMLEALQLEGGERVLEVGAGCGYAAAVLASIAGRVCAVERQAELAEGARERLARLGYENVEIRCGDGTRGWPEEAPFDAILVSAGGPAAPEALKGQLSLGGRLVIPVGAEPREQELLRITRTGADAYRQEALGPVRFVPLVGAEGWREPLEDAGGSARGR